MVLLLKTTLSGCMRQCFKKLSSQAIPVTAKRTSESNPTNHSLDQVGLFYTVPDKDKQQIFSSGGLPRSFEDNLKTFAETCFMIRKPALEIIHLLNTTDFNRPVVRYVLYKVAQGEGRRIRTLSALLTHNGGGKEKVSRQTQSSLPGRLLRPNYPGNRIYVNEKFGLVKGGELTRFDWSVKSNIWENLTSALDGRPGCGKSVSLAHVLHYAHLNNFIIVHVPWVWNWFRSDRTEVVYCSSDKESVNLPLVSAHWLKHFQQQNSEFFKTADLSISKDYVWSQRENTPAGSQLADLVTHGINRVKYAADCVSAIIFELKAACNAGKTKVMVAVDGFNAFFGDSTNLKTEDRVKVKPGMVTLRNTFVEATKQDWKNGAIVLTVDQMSARHQTKDNEFPIYLLGRKGFEHLDPFVPVEVSELSDLEANSMLDYYEDRKWLIKSQGRSELVFLSNKNPYVLMNLCNGL